MVADRLRAEELTQDVFVRAWEKLHLFRGESSFATWLHRLTVNVVLNARKVEGRQRSRYEENDDDAGMDALPGVVGMPLPPGDMLGVTSGATKAQLHRARLLLREALNR